MDVRVGLICEGPTDRPVIERVLAALSAGRTVVNPIQPPHPMLPGVHFGGWEQVFASIERRDISSALAFNDFVVVQIDTDVCEEPAYGVGRREGGTELSEIELVGRVRERLTREIREKDPGADLLRVVFAICVEQIECWLFCHLTGTGRTKGCLGAVDRVLARKRRPTLHSKQVRAYEEAAHDLRRAKAVEAARAVSGSMSKFVDDVRPLLAPATDGDHEV